MQALASYMMNVSLNQGAFTVTGSGTVLGMMGAMLALYAADGHEHPANLRTGITGNVFASIRSVWRSVLAFVPRHVLFILIPVAAANVYIGATSEYVDNYTHVASFLTGILLAYALRPSYEMDRGFGFVARVKEVSSVWQRWQVLALIAALLVTGTCVGNLN